MATEHLDDEAADDDRPQHPIKPLPMAVAAFAAFVVSVAFGSAHLWPFFVLTGLLTISFTYLAVTAYRAVRQQQQGGRS